MKVRNKLIATLLAVTVVNVALAADKKKDAPSPWKGSKVSLGDITTTTGKKSSTNITFNSILNYNLKRWTETGQASFQYGKNDGVLNKKQYSVQNQLQYSFNDNAKIDNYGYVKGSYQHDDFAAYQSQIVAMAGYGRDWIKNKTFQVTTQIAPGIRQLKEQSPSNKVSNNAALQLSLLTTWQLTKYFSASESADYTIGHPANYLKSTTSLVSALTGSLALSVDFEFDYWSSPPKSGSQVTTSTSTSVSLVYSFSS